MLFRSIEEYLLQLMEQYNALRIICEEADSTSIPEEQKEIFFYQFAAARYGRDFMKFNIEWHKNFLNEIRSETI